MGETELWVFRILLGFIGTIGCTLGGDYLLNVRGGDLFRRKKDCETIAQIFHKENREDHQKITDKLEKVGHAIAAMEGELRRMNGSRGNA